MLGVIIPTTLLANINNYSLLGIVLSASHTNSLNVEIILKDNIVFIPLQMQLKQPKYREVEHQLTGYLCTWLPN